MGLSVEEYVFSQVKTVLPGNANKPISREMDLVMDLNADSLSIVSLIFSIDEQFDTGTDELGDLINECRTVGDLIDAAERLREKRHSFT